MVIKIWQPAFWPAVASGVYYIAQWAMLSIVAKYDSITVLGTYALALAVVTPILLVAQMQLRQVVVTDATRGTSFGAYLVTRAIFVVLAIFAVAVISITIRWDSAFAMVAVLLAMAKGIEAIGDLAHGSLQRDGRLSLASKLLIVRVLLGLGGFWWSYDRSLALTDALWTYICISLLYVSLLEIPLASKHAGPAAAGGKAVWQSVARIVRRTWILSVVAGLVAVSTQVPRYFLEALSGSEAVALFSIAAVPAAIPLVLQTSISQGLLRRLTELHHGDPKGFDWLVRRITAANAVIGGIVLLVLWAFGDAVLAFLSSEQYIAAQSTAVLLAVYFLLGTIALRSSYIVVVSQSFGLQLWNMLGTLAVQVALAAILVPRYGIEGAALAECGKQLAAVLLLVFLARRVSNSTRAIAA